MKATHLVVRTATAALLLVSAGCGSSANSTTSDPATLRLGYLTNLTHATALVGVSYGYFEDKLKGTGATLKTTTFNAGPDEVEALLSGSIDAAFLGPNPAITAFTRSHGAIRVVAGAAQGGAGLVVKPSIQSAADLKGKTLATPQLGNTQDVALRYWLQQHGLATNTTGGGDVHIAPQDNAQTLQTFKAGQIDGAWVPEPWLTRLQVEGGAKLLVDERTLWPQGKFTTTLLAVRTDFLNQHAKVVDALLTGEITANRFLEGSPAAAQTAANEALKTLTTKGLSAAVLAGSWSDLTFTEDPDAASVRAAAAHAHALGLLSAQANLSSMFDLGPLNAALQAQHLPAVSAS